MNPRPAALVEAEKKTVERFEHREAQATTYVASAEGRAFCETLLPYLAEFMLSQDAPAPPEGGLSIAIRERKLAPEELALVVLSPLLHQIAAGRKKGERSPAMKLKLAMGRVLHDKLLMKGLLKQNRKAHKKVMKAEIKQLAVWKYREPYWSREQYVRAGNWLLDCVLQGLPTYFALERDGFPCVTEAGKEFVLRLRDELVYLDPVFQPATEELQDWADLRCGCYWDDGTRISATFVRDSHPDTKTVITRAFRDGSMRPHIDGVNALQRVAWATNAEMIPIVEKFAGTGKIGKRVSELLVAEDVATARRLGAKTFYVPMSCDKRGRVYGISHFNFQREDHVRALFRFARGMPIAPLEPDGGNINWLMIHIANCGDFGGVSKHPWVERIRWVKERSDMIMRVAQDPEGNVNLWCDADSPFSFVAACKELAGIWETGSSYITHLPICFDGSYSGIQHLAMMTQDEATGRLVNLVPDDMPHDIYQLITDLVIEYLKQSGDVKAGWWLRRGVTRKLVKRPAMTFAYNATLDGMQEHIDEIESGGDSFFLAQLIMRACKETLPRPAEAMKFIRGLAQECADKGKILEWRTPTGFPWANRYHESKVETVDLELCGVRVRHKVADGYEPGLRKRKIMDAAAPNFVHALDASHLIRVVNAAVNEDIKSLAVVHDSFGCLAPQAHRLHLIIREEMAKLYASRDVLADLRAASGSPLKLPEKGSLNPWDVELSTYAFA